MSCVAALDKCTPQFRVRQSCLVSQSGSMGVRTSTKRRSRWLVGRQYFANAHTYQTKRGTLNCQAKSNNLHLLRYAHWHHRTHNQNKRARHSQTEISNPLRTDPLRVLQVVVWKMLGYRRVWFWHNLASKVLWSHRQHQFQSVFVEGIGGWITVCWLFWWYFPVVWEEFFGRCVSKMSLSRTFSCKKITVLNNVTCN